jgi:hypothetical protein
MPHFTADPLLDAFDNKAALVILFNQKPTQWYTVADNVQSRFIANDLVLDGVLEYDKRLDMYRIKQWK